HERLRPLGLGAVDGDADETQGDRADHALDLDRRDRSGRGRCHDGNGEQREDEHEAGASRDRLQTLTTRPHFWSARTLTSSKRRLAPSSAVIWPGPSYGGETSTTSAPTSACPASARTSRSEERRVGDAGGVTRA